jgi:hypothetical protein
MMALTGEGDLEVNKEEVRPAFGLEAHKKEGREKGAPAKVHWPLNKASVCVFMRFRRTSMLR